MAHYPVFDASKNEAGRAELRLVVLERVLRACFAGPDLECPPAHRGIGPRPTRGRHGSFLGAGSAEQLHRVCAFCETARVRAPDLVDVVEAAYIPHTPSAWLGHVARALRPLLERGGGLLGYGFDASDMRLIKLGDPVFAGACPEVWSAMQRSTDGLEPRAVQRTYLGSQPFGTVAQRFLGSTRGVFSELARRHYAPNGFADLLVLHIVDADRRGCLFATPLPTSAAASRKEIRMWSRVAAHLRAGYRSSVRHGDDVEAVDAILEPNGRALHARGFATTRAGREVLREAALRAQRARTARARADVSSALDLWQELIAGRWTLIERFDADGRRFLLARRNEADVQRHVQLTSREREIASRVLRGDSSKLIAHDLLVSEATISEHLKHALAKLNLRSVDDLREAHAPKVGRKPRQ
jgi:DNA-binding NarL/FixJ family response regulator